MLLPRHARSALSGLSTGDIVSGKVSILKDQGVFVDNGQFKVWIPLSELAWSWISHPSEAVSLGQVVKAEIMRIELPEDWLNNKGMRRARAVGSVRAVIPQPESPMVQVAYSSLPFKVSAVAKTPRDCDPVVLYLLEELAASKLPDDIQETTGLPRKVLDSVHKVLVSEGLVSN